MSHTYVQNLVHVVFSTKERRKFIPLDHRTKLWAFMAGVCNKEKIMPHFTVIAPLGSLQLTQFDAKGMAGKFSFTAVEDGGTRKVSVSGTFKYARR